MRSGRVPTPVTINKCCRLGEGMDTHSQCNVGGTDMWVPHVYLINKATWFMPKGEAPRFFKIKEGIKPTTCIEPELYVGSTEVVLFSNGSLYIRERNLLVSGDDYCVEKDMALVCLRRPAGANSLTAPSKLTKVKKCCFEDQAYREDNFGCAKLESGHHVLSKRIVNSTAVDVVYGFPKCDNNSFTVAGKFHSFNFNETSGTVTLTSGREILSGNYCLDHIVNDDVDSSVNIFTCADHNIDPETVPINPSVSVKLIVSF